MVTSHKAAIKVQDSSRATCRISELIPCVLRPLRLQAAVTSCLRKVLSAKASLDKSASEKLEREAEEYRQAKKRKEVEEEAEKLEALKRHAK